jgi:hypothetical protein
MDQEIRVRIRQRGRSVLQSGRFHSRDWLIEFEPECRPEIEPLMGWTETADPFNSAGELRFADMGSAIAFAVRRGWEFRVHRPKEQKVIPQFTLIRFRIHRIIAREMMMDVSAGQKTPSYSRSD